MMKALEVAGMILYLPTLLCADFLPLRTTAGASPLFGAQLVYMRGDGEMVEVGKMPAPFAPLHPAKFFFWWGFGWNIAGVDRLALQLLGECQQQLCQLVGRTQLVGARTVAGLLIAVQLYLQSQNFQVKIVALAQQRGNHGLKRFFVVR
jgi:hypothetical protein